MSSDAWSSWFTRAAARLGSGTTAWLVVSCLAAPAHGQPISQYLCGQNVWMPASYQSTTGPVDLGGSLDQHWDVVEQSGVQLVRIGGNRYNNTPPSAQQMLQWVDQIRAIGAEPIVQVSRHLTTTQAEDLVR